jgi:hypothetical protein
MPIGSKIEYDERELLAEQAAPCPCRLELSVVDILNAISDHEKRVVEKNWQDMRWESIHNHAFRDGNLSACRKLRNELLQLIGK